MGQLTGTNTLFHMAGLMHAQHLAQVGVVTVHFAATIDTAPSRPRPSLDGSY